MTSITAQTTATLDGVIDAAPADALLPYMSDAGRQGALDLALAADALLLPRETWQGLARAWRDQPGPRAERLNTMPKYVVSATLESADEWDHTTIVGYDDIAGLREREQLVTYGCGRLAWDLLADGLLDVLVLSLTPVVVGAGRRLFDDPGHLGRLRLTDSTTFETGAVPLSLDPAASAPGERVTRPAHEPRRRRRPRLHGAPGAPRSACASRCARSAVSSWPAQSSLASARASSRSVFARAWRIPVSVGETAITRPTCGSRKLAI